MRVSVFTRVFGLDGWSATCGIDTTSSEEGDLALPDAYPCGDGANTAFPEVVLTSQDAASKMELFPAPMES
jgi:hypothetical protein